MMKKLMSVVLLISMLSPVSADEFLSEAQIKELFTNKSFDVHNVTKGKDLQGYANADGEHYIYIPWKDKISERKWWTDGAMHCTSHPKRGDNCKKMKPVGEGVYHGFSNGEHTHTLSNFRDGRHLPD